MREDQQPTEIDRSSAIPLYHQLERLLRHEIESGRLRPGAPLPSESEIRARHGVSRSVIRQTLTNLANAGLIRTERGRGSFVGEPKLQERFVQSPTGLHDDLRRMGHPMRTEVLRQKLAVLPVPAQEFLGVAEGIQLDRLRSVEGRTLAFIRSYLRADLCPGLERHDLEDTSLYETLDREYQLRPGSGRRTVEAVAAEGEIAEHLGVAPGEPLLLLRSSSRAEDGQALEWFEAWHRADRTAFEIEILPGGQERTSNVLMDTAPTAAHSAPAGDAEQRRAEFEETVRRSRVVAVLRAERYEKPAEVARALVDAGLPVVEFTLTGANALAAIGEAATVEGAVVGAGTVRTAADARAAIAAGATFLVSPVPATEVTDAAGAVPTVLSGYTPQEVWTAWRATHGPVKLFPSGGPDHVRALRGPMPEIPLVPSGGVDEHNAAAYLEAGAVAVNVGTALCPAAALATGDVSEISARADRLRAALG